MPQVTIPEMNNINRQAGSLVLTIEDDSTTVANLLKTGPFLLKKETTGFSISTDNNNINKQLKVESPTTGNVTLIWSWIKNNHRLTVIDNVQKAVYSATKEDSAMDEDFGLIDLVNPIIKINGLSEQSGVPSPEMPIEINSLDKNFSIVSSSKSRNLLVDSQHIVLMGNDAGWGESVLRTDEDVPYYHVHGDNFISTYEWWTHEWMNENCVVGEFYTISVDVRLATAGVVKLAEDDNNTKEIATANVWTRIFHTFDYTQGYWAVNIDYTGTDYEYRNWKLEAGSQETSWTPAPEDIQVNTQTNSVYKTSLSLNNPLRSIGDVKDTLFLDADNLWKIKRAVAEKIFDGSESWTLQVANTLTTRFTFAMPNIKLLAKVSSDLFEQTAQGTDVEGIGGHGSAFVFQLTINKTRVQTAAELKTWIAANPLTVQFELLNPIIETLTSEQQIYLNALQGNLNGRVLYAMDETLTSESAGVFFEGSYQALAIYAQDTLYDPAEIGLIAKLTESGTVLFDADYLQPMHYAKKPFLEATMTPRDNSPILVNNEEGPMQRQYFFDQTTGVYGETNTESFVYRGEDELAVSYDKLDTSYLVTVRSDAESLGEPVTVIDNRILLTMTPEQKEYWYGKTFDVTYRLANSYTVEYNENAAHDSYIVRLENHQDQEVSITQEGNRFSTERLMKEIELNPIVNPQHTGFLYISKEEQISQAFRLNLSSNYIIANGLDSADFIVEVIDQDGNEVLSPYIDVFIMNELGLVTSQFGSFAPIINKDTLKAKNAAGRSYFKYQSPLIRKTDTKKVQKVFAVAYDRKHKIGAQVPLILRPSEPVYDITGQNYLAVKLPAQTRSDAAIVFEYFARFYEKPIPANHPILLLDSDQDGSLTYTDLTQFLTEQTNAVRMQEIAYALRETEAF